MNLNQTYNVGWSTKLEQKMVNEKQHVKNNEMNALQKWSFRRNSKKIRQRVSVKCKMIFEFQRMDVNFPYKKILVIKWVFGK